MVGISRVLYLYPLKPGVFPGRLVEMSVDAEKALYLAPSAHPVKDEALWTATDCNF